MIEQDIKESELSRAYSKILAWEKDVGIFDYLVDDVPLWRLIRNATVVSFTVSKGLEQPHRVESVSLGGLTAISKGVLSSAAQFIKIPKSDLLFWGSSRRQRGADSWVDPLTDPIIDCLSDYRSISFERPLQGRHRSPASTKRLIWYDAPKVFARLRSRLPVIVSAEDQSVISELAKLISNEFDRPKSRIEKLLKKELAAFRVERAAANLILSRTKPKAVFVVNRWINRGVLAACSQRVIPTFEFQHGAVGKEGFKNYTPYSEVLDPDQFLVFGEEWKKYEWGVPADRIQNVGSPFIWNQRSSRAGAPRGDQTMLVSQPNLSKGMSAAFEEICRALPQQRFLLQLHPQDRENVTLKYPLVRLPNVEVARETTPLYESFMQCQAVIGQDSTALLEASFFDLKVGLLDLPEALESTIRSRIGYANFFDASTVDLVKEMLASPRRSEAENGNGYFDAFKEDKLRALLAKQ